MKYLVYYILFILFALSALTANAQEPKGVFDLHIQVRDKQTKEPLEFALVYLTDGNRHRDAICNEGGKTSIDNLHAGKYKLTISYIGYKKWEEELNIDSDKTLDILLTSNSNELNEVIVTASESRGMTSSSIIDQKAMQHLQPSSFTDLLELLPGGKSQNPSFSSANIIKIRETARPSNNYDILSLGVSFVMDGAPISTDANMQYLSSGDATILGASGYTDSKRRSMNKGVDMRSISTDQIERVEIVRGIPSVQYGELTSGLVKIERKKGATPWTARLKVDGYSKLFAGNKGFNFKEKNITLNFGIDFLDSNNNPTNTYEGYQRLTYSIRLGKTWNKESFNLNWQSNFDHGHTFDKVRVDPNIYDGVQESADLDYIKKDRYKSKYDRFSLSNNFKLKPKKIPFLKSIDLNTSVSYELDKIEQTKFIQLNSLTLTIPSSDESGIYDGIYLPSKYLSDSEVDGKPLNIFLQGIANVEFSTAMINHKAMIGGGWTLDKNYGKGQVFDRERPPGEDIIRSRKYSDIPSKQNINVFVEDEIAMPIGSNIFKLNAGIRGMSMVGMDSRYKMNNKLYFDPRFNAEWSFPAIEIKNKALNLALSGGIGWQSKFPTLIHLYPDYVYRDYVRLNYYNTDNPEQSRVNYETYKTKTINYDLEPAQNKKWEVRLNVEYDNNKFSVTYFQEKMTNGFRNQTMDFQSVSYKKYVDDGGKDDNYIVIDPITNRPDLDKSLYNVFTVLQRNSAMGNGSVIEKKGVEYTLSTKRFNLIKTRLTINGAWFKTRYTHNTQMYTDKMSKLTRPDESSPIRIYREAYGIFDSSGGDSGSQFNTNFMLDTYIPELGFEFSTSIQCMWYEMDQRMHETRYPDYYIDGKGIIQPFTEVEQEDPFLKLLIRESNSSLFRKKRTPLGIDINLKASKKIKDIMRISLFVNRLLDYYPDYEINGAVIKRSSTPYFGMELNITL